MSHPFAIPLYVSHSGTVRISGASESKKVASCALHFLSQDLGPVDFFYIGANAGQQAMKAMGILRYTVEKYTEGKTTVLFQPNRVQTETQDHADRSKTLLVDAVYWRTYAVGAVQLADLLKSSNALKSTIPAVPPVAQ